MRVINGFDGLTRALLESAAVFPIALDTIAAPLTAVVLEKNVRAQYGSHDLAPLAQATQDERVQLGFSPADPLLRDGTLLRSSVEHDHIGPMAAAGSAEPVAGYSEAGFVSARSGVSVPPRPAFRNGLSASREEVVGPIMDGVLDVTFSGRVKP